MERKSIAWVVINCKLLVLFWMMKILFLPPLIGRLIILCVLALIDDLNFGLFFFVIIMDSFCCYSTLRRWRKGKVVDSWEAHKSAIQAIIKLPSGELVTGIFSAYFFCGILVILPWVKNMSAAFGKLNEKLILALLKCWFRRRICSEPLTSSFRIKILVLWSVLACICVLEVFFLIFPLLIRTLNRSPFHIQIHGSNGLVFVCQTLNNLTFLSMTM